MTGVDPWVFFYGLYLGGYLGELSRQIDRVMSADGRTKDEIWPSVILRPVLWPVFFIATLILAALRA